MTTILRSKCRGGRHWREDALNFHSLVRNEDVTASRGSSADLLRPIRARPRDSESRQGFARQGELLTEMSGIPYIAADKRRSNPIC